VAAGSLSITDDRRKAFFQIEGKEQALAVQCDGPLPDNLAEGIEVVVEGTLRTGCLLDGDRVITRCASKYTPLGEKSVGKETAEILADPESNRIATN
jgi:cytochrome c-type biogenesis protein CcmE